MTVILQIRDLQHPQSSSLLSLAERQASEYFSTSPDSSEYKSSDEFHIASRLLELRAQLSRSKSDSSHSEIPKFPSLSTTESTRTPSQRLLDHFASKEGEKWCERNLGFELWRRESELRFGSNEGGEWKRSWDRLKVQLDKGWAFSNRLLETSTDNVRLQGYELAHDALPHSLRFRYSHKLFDLLL